MSLHQRYPAANAGRDRGSAVLLSLTRLWLPLVIALSGVGAIVIGRGHTVVASAGVGLLLVAIIVWMINWMYRMSVQSNRDREQDERDREYFDVHGHWPEDRSGPRA